MKNLALTTGTLAPYPVLFGAGSNWFDLLGMGGHYADATKYYKLNDPCYPPLDDEAAWDALLSTLTRMKLGFIRFGIPADPHVKPDSSITWDTPHVQRLRRVARWAKVHQCTILLDTFLLPHSFTMARPAVLRQPNEGGMVQMAARDNRELAKRFYAPWLAGFCADADFDAVTWFNPVNEPFGYGVYQTPPEGPDPYAWYVEMFRELRLGLDALGVTRDRMKLAGMDLTFEKPAPHLRGLLSESDLMPWVDALSIHFYHICFDHRPRETKLGKEDWSWWPMGESIDQSAADLAAFCRVHQKPLLAPEIGTFHYGFRDSPPAVASFPALLTVFEGVIRCLNAGISTFAFWSLLNPNTIDGQWRTFRIHGNMAKFARYAGPVRMALSQAVRPGLTVYPLKVEGANGFVHAVELRSEMILTLLIVNDSETTPCSLRLDASMSSLSLYRFAEAGCLQDFDGMTDGTLHLPKFSAAILTTELLDLPAEEEIETSEQAAMCGS